MKRQPPRLAVLCVIGLGVTLLLPLHARQTHADGTGPVRAPLGPVEGSGASGPEVTAYHPNRVLIKLTAAASASFVQGGGAISSTRPVTLDAVHQSVGAVRMDRAMTRFQRAEQAIEIGLDRWYMVEIAGSNLDVEEIARRYRLDASVEAATPDYQAYYATVPNDPSYASQWGHNNTAQMLSYCWNCGGHPAGSPVGTVGFDANAEQAWTNLASFGSPSVVVAILDSGTDIDHPDLVAHLVAGFDHGDNDSNPDDDSASPGHGTACAGVAGATAGNALGVAGIAGGVSIMPLKVANSAGSMFFSAIQNALIYAADHGVDVASMSFGAAISSDPATDNAITYAYNAGVTMLAATGNGNKTVIQYPAINASVIAVGAASPCGQRKRSSNLSTEVNPGVSTDPNGYTCDGERWWGSSYGVNTVDAGGAVDVIAPTIMPTTDIAGAGGYTPGDYELWFNGTSCATPYAAGVCALILSANPGWTPAQVRSRLTSTAIDIVSVESAAGWDRYAGYGMVDAAAAVGGGAPPTPPAAPSGLAAVAVSSSQINLTWTDNANDETGFNIERSTNGTSFSPLATVGANVISYSNTGLAASTTYWYRVNASNGAGTSAYSNVANATTAAPAWTTITLDNFESGMGSYTDGGSDMSRYTGGTYAHQGVAAADIQDNSGTSSSFYHTLGYNVTGYTDLEVKFWYRGQSMENGEDFWVQYFDGSVWRTVATFVAGTHFTNGTFNNVTVSILRTSYNFPTNAKLRFMCDAGDNNDDVYIDEIEFRGRSAAAMPFVAASAPVETPQFVHERSFGLGQNVPNPFQSETSIGFSLATDEDVDISVFDIAGRKVASLANRRFGAGDHRVRWDARGAAKGIYFYRIQAGENVATRRMLVR